MQYGSCTAGQRLTDRHQGHEPITILFTLIKHTLSSICVRCSIQVPLVYFTYNSHVSIHQALVCIGDTIHTVEYIQTHKGT